jgi:KaiC/GvpD/RAD55 family RecA-like ATPase
MESSVSSFQQLLIERLSGYPFAVEAVVEFCRGLWWTALERPDSTRRDTNERKKKQDVLHFRTEHFESTGLIGQHTDLFNACLLELSKKRMCRKAEDGHFELRVIDFRNMLVFPRALLGGIRPDADLRYFVMRSLRKRYNANLSPETVRRFNILGDVVQRARAAVEKKSKSDDVERVSSRVNFIALYDNILEILRSERNWDDASSWIRLFFECRWAVGVVNLAFSIGAIKFDTDAVDTDFLVSKLFAIPTSITGFDELFVGGLILSEQPIINSASLTEAPEEQALFKGRTVYIKGMAGNGKSLLAIQIAAEVARKGGISHVLLFEQTIAECLFVLNSMRAIPDDNSVKIAFTPAEIGRVLARRDPNIGAIVLVHGRAGDFHVYLDSLRRHSARLREYPLRALIVDPINSVHHGDEEESVNLRAEAVRAIWDLKRAGTNLILVAEEGTEPSGQFLFEENIADTVIRLWTEQKHGYARRFFQILKSRFQREQRGPHPFSILPNSGISIYASPAAVSARISPRSRVMPSEVPYQVSLGVEGLDDLTGPQPGVYSGDLVVFTGPPGSYKLHIAISFLLAPNLISGSTKDRSSNVSLMITPRDQEVNIKHLMSQDYLSSFRRRTDTQLPEVRYCVFGGKAETPGAILQRIEDTFEMANQEGVRIDRVVVDDIAYWDVGRSIVNEDGQFGSALMDLLRSKRVTSLFVCNAIRVGCEVTLQQEIMDGADCLIALQHQEYRGDHRVIGRIETTRDMRHQRETFEVIYNANEIGVRRTSSLLRLRSGDAMEPIPIRLLLHAESEAQREYNNRIAEGIAAVLSSDTRIVPQSRVFEGKAMRLGSSSCAVDELQILQMDEYQLPVFAHGRIRQQMIHEFTRDQWKQNLPEWSDFFRRMISVSHRGGRFFAVPYYTNVGLLAYSENEVTGECESWVELSEICDRWERNHKPGTEVFFDFARNMPENYNCLFLEILTSLLAMNESGQRLLALLRQPHIGHKMRLWELVGKSEAREAARIMRRLCLRAERISQDACHDVRAIVSRHWYATLNVLMREMSMTQRKKTLVRTLPGNVTIAGEWFLTVPSYSAAIDVGLEVIKVLTSHEAESERLHLGVGLPVRSSFYHDESRTDYHEAVVSPFFTFNKGRLGELVENAVRRSAIYNYTRVAGLLSSQLKAIIAIEGTNDAVVRQKIVERFDDLEAQLRFVESF